YRGHPQLRDYLTAFQEDVLNLLVTAPEQRPMGAVSRKLGITATELQTIIDYYVSQYFRVDLQLADQNPAEVLNRLRELRREHSLGDSDSKQHPNLTDYAYYLLNITHLSVPEMAVQLARHRGGVTEQQVYQELLELGISIEDEFSQQGILQQARDRYRQGEKLEDIAAQLHIGRQALEFILHFENERARAVKWDRRHQFRGRNTPEELILRVLHYEGQSAANIAKELNQLAGNVPADSPDFRTEASVSARIQLLNLAAKHRMGAPDVVDPDEPSRYLKKNGKLVEDNAIAFLAAHYYEPLAWLAQQMGVTESGLRAFIRRHNIPYFTKTAAPSTTGASTSASAPLPVSSILKGYAKQRSAAEKGVRLSQWMAGHGGGVPKAIKKKKSDITPDEQAQNQVYEDLRRFAATDEEMAANTEKRIFMEQLTAQQKQAVQAWYIGPERQKARQKQEEGKRRGGPKERGENLSRFMSANNNQVPATIKKRISEMTVEQRVQKQAYVDMLGLAATDEEMATNAEKRIFMEQLTPEQKNAVQAWRIDPERLKAQWAQQERRRRGGPKERGENLSRIMSANNNQVPSATAKKISHMSTDEGAKQQAYHDMLRLAATDEEMTADPEKRIFMEQLTPEQKQVVQAWRTDPERQKAQRAIREGKRRGGPKERGENFSRFMSDNNNQLPLPNKKKKHDDLTSREQAQNHAYYDMYRLAATDEEMAADPEKRTFMEQLTAEQKAIVQRWHMHRAR
ncbi:MAG: hypothetical protein HY537_00805, partial [Deltaproteobacteria bacterium]|nr:hypothetical protein [Deltaproteobacteria bacterium]